MNKIVPLLCVGLAAFMPTTAHAGTHNGVDFASWINYGGASGAGSAFGGAYGNTIVVNLSASANGGPIPPRWSFNDDKDCRGIYYAEENIDWFWDTADPENDPAPAVRPIYAYPFVTILSGVTSDINRGSSQVDLTWNNDRGDYIFAGGGPDSAGQPYNDTPSSTIVYNYEGAVSGTFHTGQWTYLDTQVWAVTWDESVSSSAGVMFNGAGIVTLSTPDPAFPPNP